MPKPIRAQSTLSGLVGSDSDDQLMEANTMPTPDSAAENKAPARKGRAKAKAAAPAKAAKAKAKASGRQVETKVKPAARAGRKALADKTNRQEGSDTEEVDDFEQKEDVEMEDELDTSIVEVKETKVKATHKKAAVGRGKAAQDATHDPEETAPAVNPRAKKEKLPPKQSAAPSSPEKVIMETQMPMEIEEDEEVTRTVSRVAPSAARRRSQSRARQPSVQRRRAGSASDTERNDPALRRKLGEITKKYDSLNVKYQDLREIGLKEAERNFERLKKQTEEKTAASDKLIASLKADAAAQASLAKESRGLKKKVESQLEEMATLRAQVAQVKASLEEAQAQNKTLSTKLAANRNTASSVESTNAKATGGNANVVTQAAQLKEDMYSDLTGLIIRGVKREAEDDIFDCIQTGRNGTLHFKLSAANEKASESYEDAQCQYVPQLDPGRDSALMELLPDYLVDEITFPRPQAAKFYARVVKALTEKLD